MDILLLKTDDPKLTVLYKLVTSPIPDKEGKGMVAIVLNLDQWREGICSFHDAGILNDKYELTDTIPSFWSIKISMPMIDGENHLQILILFKKTVVVYFDSLNGVQDHLGTEEIHLAPFWVKTQYKEIYRLNSNRL